MRGAVECQPEPCDEGCVECQHRTVHSHEIGGCWAKLEPCDEECQHRMVHSHEIGGCWAKPEPCDEECQHRKFHAHEIGGCWAKPEPCDEGCTQSVNICGTFWCPLATSIRRRPGA